MEVFPERRLIEAYVIFLVASVITTPDFAFSLLLFVAAPLDHFNTSNWIFLGLLFVILSLLIVVSVSASFSVLAKWLVWGVSSVFWGFYFVFLVQSSSMFARPWLVWMPHLLLALISIFMITKLVTGKVNNEFSPVAGISAHSRIKTAVFMIVFMIGLISFFNVYIDSRKGSCEERCVAVGLEYSYDSPTLKRGYWGWRLIEADKCVCK